MKGANSSKWMYMRSTADIPLKWNDICNADIIPNRSYMRSIADIPKLYEMANLKFNKGKGLYYRR